MTILGPVVVAAGVDPLQFGVIIVVHPLIGAPTPPRGMLIFTAARVGGDVCRHRSWHDHRAHLDAPEQLRG